MPRIAQVRPLAIAMWDTGWLTRHYPYGSFADWDRALDGLVDRGYNAIRIDAFPHLVAAGPDGTVQERFFRSRGDGMEHMWRNAWSTYLEPRAGLEAFLPKCRERGIYVGLSTWFPDVRENRHIDLQGVDAFVRIWHETLSFLDSKGLLDTVIYVDLLNEYPLYHSFEWLKTALARLGEQQGVTEETGNQYNPQQFAFYKTFATTTLQKLKAAWPALDFLYSFTHSHSVPWDQMELRAFDALDVHHWFVQNTDFSTSTDYFPAIHSATQSDAGYEECQEKIRCEWPARKTALTSWMREKLAHVAAIAQSLDIPYGNTEGWGPIMWREHPLLDWMFVKEAGFIGARLGAELGFAFNCSSNFTHPQFQGLWDDVAWHREVTAIIRGA